MILRVVISRGVIFAEDEQWEWNASFEKQISLDLEWGNAEINVEEELEAEMDENIGSIEYDREENQTT